MSDMTMKREGAILEGAVTKYGPGPQTDMMIEEMSELTKALIRYRRAIARGSQGQNREAFLQSVLEEMADVQIMLNQMVLIYGDFTEWEIAKLECLETRLYADATDLG